MSQELSGKISNRPTFHEIVVPYRGNWSFPWVAQRYLRTFYSGLTPLKALNAAIAFRDMMRGKTVIKSKPVVLRIEPTNNCNLSCPRCSCGTGSDPRKKGFITTADYRFVLEENSDSAALVRLDGNGEPMLHPEIFKMIKIAKSYKYGVTLSTNLNSSPEAGMEGFLESGLDRLVVAIDGSSQQIYEKYRVGGDLSVVENNLLSLGNLRRKYKVKKPFIEIQFLDWGYNHQDINSMRQKVRLWEADKLEVISPDWSVNNASANARSPKRCFWLWWVLTVDWQLNYHSCTNAWTLRWPGLNMRDVPSKEFWNHQLMTEARKYNLNKSSSVISSDSNCHCNNCSDMLVVNRPSGYVCE